MIKSPKDYWMPSVQSNFNNRYLDSTDEKLRELLALCVRDQLDHHIWGAQLAAIGLCWMDCITNELKRREHERSQNSAQAA